MSVEVEFTDEVAEQDIQEFLDNPGIYRITDVLNEGTLLSYQEDSQKAQIDFGVLRNVVWEWLMYTEAQGFTSNHVEVARAVKDGPTRMRFGEIREAVNGKRSEELADSTIRSYLRNLREMNIIEMTGEGPNTNYDYTGP